MPESTVLLFDGASGVYIPQRFAQECRHWEGVSEEDFEILLSGPEHELYWGTWDTTLGDAYYMADNGGKYVLYQDGDCWAYCLECMTLEEQKNFFQPSSPDDYYIPPGFTLFTVGSHFLPALYYNDLSALDAADEAALTAFEALNGDDITDSMPYGLDGCEITGLLSECSLILLRTPES